MGANSTIFNKKSENEAEIYLYDVIGYEYDGGMTAARFAQVLKDIGPVDKITLRINSPGGIVWEGWAMWNLLKQNPAKKKTIVDGIAASCASLLAMAGDEIEMGTGTQMMIHDPYCYYGGGSAGFRSAADRLDNIKNDLVAVYSAKTGLKPAKISQMMSDETWLTAEQCKTQGFCTGLIKDLQAKACAKASYFDKLEFKNIPAEVKALQDQAADTSEADKAAALNEMKLMRERIAKSLEQQPSTT